MFRTTLYSLLFLGVTAFAVPSANAIGFDVGLGPFYFNLDSGVRVGTPFYESYHDPICRAIQDRDLLAIYTQEGDDVKRVIIEPYAFGYNKDGNLVLQGYQVEGFNLNKEPSDNLGGEGFVGGVFTSFEGNEWKDLSISKVVRIEVLENTDFKVRKDVFDNLKTKNEIVDLICGLQP